MGFFSAVIVCAAFTFNLVNADELTPVVQTSYGPVQGIKSRSPWTNKMIYSFQGIPYASSPVGNLRFKPPVAPAAWQAIKNCTRPPRSCLQGKNFSNSGEDCLYLNIFTPQMEPTGELLPVLVWIHGGGYQSGSGDYDNNGPDFLLAEGVLVVTLNYRLGAFGFLSLDTVNVRGNAGLKDQQAALRWVQQEIRLFGGDRHRVTIFGGSSGSACVHLLYLSPSSVGLFHRAIGHSGTALAQWAISYDNLLFSRRLASLLCGSDSEAGLMEQCLMAADPWAIASAQAALYDKSVATEVAERGVSWLTFVPVVEKNKSEAFLPEAPARLIEQGQGSNVPFLMGTDSDEGFLKLSISNEHEVTNITNNLEFFIPSEVRQTSSKEQIKSMTESIRQFYFGNKSVVRGFVDLYTDVMFAYHTAVSARAYRQRAPVYLYHFTFNGTFLNQKQAKKLKDKYNITGVGHCVDLGYVFVQRSLNQTASQDSSEMKMWRRMVRMWTNFAKYGTPTVEDDSVLQHVYWLPVDSSARHLHVDTDLGMVPQDYQAASVALWDRLSAAPSTAAITMLRQGVGLLVMLLIITSFVR